MGEANLKGNPLAPSMVVFMGYDGVHKAGLNMDNSVGALLDGRGGWWANLEDEDNLQSRTSLFTDGKLQSS